MKLRYCSKVGHSVTFRVEMEGRTAVFTDGQLRKCSSLTTEMVLTQAVTKRCAGLVTMVTCIEDGHIYGDVCGMPNIGQKVTRTMRSNGEIISTSDGKGQSGQSQRDMQLVFPLCTAFIGSRWSRYVAPNEQVPVPLEVTYEILGYEKMKGFDCVKIASKVRVADANAIKGVSLQVEADGFIHFAYKEGTMVRNQARSVMIIGLRSNRRGRKPSSVTKMTMEMVMEQEL